MNQQEQNAMYVANCLICTLGESMKVCRICTFNAGLMHTSKAPVEDILFFTDEDDREEAARFMSVRFPGSLITNFQYDKKALAYTMLFKHPFMNLADYIVGLLEGGFELASAKYSAMVKNGVYEDFFTEVQKLFDQKVKENQS